jgi:hypothetical protein
MSDATKPGTVTTPPVDDKASRDAAASAERSRISGIMSCEEAKGRDKLANHLAFNTSMSVEDAKSILAQAPAATENASTANPLAAAMAKTGSPNVGSDEQAQEQQGEEAGATGILAAARMAGVRGFTQPAAKQ